MRRIGSGLAVALVLAAATAAAAEPEVLVLRGRGSPPPRPLAIERPIAPLVLAGERLWIVDEAAGRLVACRLERASRVGERRIRCAERALPGPRG